SNLPILPLAAWRQGDRPRAVGPRTPRRPSHSRIIRTVQKTTSHGGWNFIMTTPTRFFLTTAIDYPNSRPHIGTAFEKIGADVQARYRRMEGHQVYFLMGNDENTIKVAKKAAELSRDPKEYCDDMARQFKEVWRALGISFDDFIQTSEHRHHV